MTFGSTFGRVLSPTFQPKSQAAKAAGGGWWDLNGTLTSCVAAYQAKGAADEATSYVNLANSGTYDLTVSGTVGWDATNGWGVFSTSNYLNTGITAGQLWSAIVRHTNSNTTDLQFVFGTDSSTNRRFYIFPAFSGNTIAFGAGGYSTISGVQTYNGVTAIAGRRGYINGNYVGVETNAAYSGDAEYPLLIGIANNATKLYPWLGNVQAVAIYNTTLDVTTIGSLTTAMNAL